MQTADSTLSAVWRVASGLFFNFHAATAMTEPVCLHVAAFRVAGPSVRTCNRDEMAPASARIPGLWQRFFSAQPPAGAGGDGHIYGVYSGYESDADGAFDVTAGVLLAPGTAATAGAQPVDVQAGYYLVFSGQGAMPQTVIDTWGAVWRWFAAHPQRRRRFGTDFEAYEGAHRVAIHIGVQGGN